MLKATKRSLLRGVGTVLDLLPSPRHRAAAVVLKRSPADALRSDWARVGQSLNIAVKKERRVQQERIGQKENAGADRHRKAL